MSGTPYIRFFGDDWLSGTQELTLEERGALITIVALTAAMGRPPAYDLDRISRRLGCTKGKAKKVLQNLMDLKKITVESDDIINARAMKEVKKSQENSQKQSENANARWSKSEEKPNKNKGSQDAAAMPRECQPEPEPEKNPIIPFDEFWSAYPSCKRKTDKPQARATFEKIVRGKHKQIPKTDPAKIVEGVRRYGRSGPDPEFIPIPNKWLNGERWENHANENEGADFGAFGKGEVVR